MKNDHQHYHVAIARRILFLSVVGLVAATGQAPLADEKPTDMKLYDRFLFAPSRHPEGDWEPDGIEFEDVYFKSADGTRLHGWFCPHPQAKALLIYAHGNAGHLAHRAPLVPRLQTQIPAHIFMFDYRGYGRSEGTATVAGALADAEAALVAAQQKADMPLERTIFMGRSLGGAIMIQLAAKHPPALMVIESSFTSLRDVGKKHFSAVAYLVPRKTLASADALKVLKQPIFISHGDRDQVIPYSHGQNLFQASAAPPGNKVFFRIQNAGHNDRLPDAYYRQMGQFARKHLGF